MKPRPASIQQLSVGDGERLRAIRLRSLQDAPDAFATPFEEAAARPLESWNRQLEQVVTFVATADASDVGLVRCAPHDQDGNARYLISMWVAPEARRQGIGAALVDAVIQWGRARHVNRLFLDVTETNTAAIALYSRKGFVPTGEVGTLPPPRDHIREIKMVMRL